MAHFHITTTAATTVGKDIRNLLVTINATLAGTVTIADSVGTVAIITNPTVGTFYEYWDLSGAVTVTASATCEITVNTGRKN